MNAAKAIMGTQLHRKILASYVLYVCLAVAILSAASPVGTRSAGARTHSTLTREAKLAVFDDAWATIDQRYYDKNFQGIDWELQRVTYRTAAADAPSSHELYAVLRRMIAALNDSHTRVFSPDEKFDWWKPRFITIGISIKEVGGLPTVVTVEPGSAPAREGLRMGDVIESVDGTPALSLLKKRQEGDLAAKGGSSRARTVAALFSGLPDTYVEVSWRTRAGKIKKSRFQRYWQQRELGIRSRRNGNIAVVEMDAFTKPIATAFAGTLREDFRNVDGIILDLRNNGGGEAEAMTDVASAFLKAGLELGRFTDRFGSSFTLSTRRRSPLMAFRIEETDVPVLVLASERTSSAAEILVAALQSAGRARVIGNDTCGCVLAIRHRHSLPDGGLLDVSEMDFQTPAGRRIEKNGIKPDQTISLEREDLYARRDRAMEFAVAELKRRSVR